MFAVQTNDIDVLPENFVSLNNTSMSQEISDTTILTDTFDRILVLGDAGTGKSVFQKQHLLKAKAPYFHWRFKIDQADHNLNFIPFLENEIYQYIVTHSDISKVDETALQDLPPFKRLSFLLDKVESITPVIISMDDVHLAPELSLQLFFDIVKNRKNIILFLTSREDIICSQINFKEISVFKPDFNKSQTFLKNHIPHSNYDTQDLHIIYELSHGNLVNMQQLAHCFKSKEKAFLLQSELKSDASADLISKRIEAFSSKEQMVLQQMAAFGEDGCLRELQAVFGIRERILKPILQVFVANKFIQLQDNERYEFSHHILYETVINSAQSYFKECYNFYKQQNDLSCLAKTAYYAEISQLHARAFVLYRKLSASFLKKSIFDKALFYAAKALENLDFLENTDATMKSRVSLHASRFNAFNIMGAFENARLETQILQKINDNAKNLDLELLVKSNLSLSLWATNNIKKAQDIACETVALVENTKNIDAIIKEKSRYAGILLDAGNINQSIKLFHTVLEDIPDTRKHQKFGLLAGAHVGAIGGLAKAYSEAGIKDTSIHFRDLGDEILRTENYDDFAKLYLLVFCGHAHMNTGFNAIPFNFFESGHTIIERMEAHSLNGRFYALQSLHETQMLNFSKANTLMIKAQKQALIFGDPLNSFISQAYLMMLLMQGRVYEFERNFDAELTKVSLTGRITETGWLHYFKGVFHTFYKHDLSQATCSLVPAKEIADQHGLDLLSEHIRELIKKSPLTSFISQEMYSENEKHSEVLDLILNTYKSANYASENISKTVN